MLELVEFWGSGGYFGIALNIGNCRNVEILRFWRFGDFWNIGEVWGILGMFGFLCICGIWEFGAIEGLFGFLFHILLFVGD